MFKDFFSFISKNIRSGWNSTDRKCAVKLLVLIAYCDGDVTLSEEGIIQKELAKIDDDLFRDDQFLAAVIGEVRSVRNDLEKSTLWLNAVCTEVETDEVRAELLKTCSSMVRADGQVHQRETEILSALQLALEGRPKA